MTTRQLNYTPDAGRTLPSNATTLELALDQLEGERLRGTLPNVAGTTGLLRQVPYLWDADNCPLAWLPLLAWAFRLDFFDTGWPESFQRAMVKNARRINQLRGTVAGLKLMLELLGHPNAEVIESPGVPRRGDASRADRGPAAAVSDTSRRCGCGPARPRAAGSAVPGPGPAGCGWPWRRCPDRSRRRRGCGPRHAGANRRAAQRTDARADRRPGQRIAHRVSDDRPRPGPQ